MLQKGAAGCIFSSAAVPFFEFSPDFSSGYLFPFIPMPGNQKLSYGSYPIFPFPS